MAAARSSLLLRLLFLLFLIAVSTAAPAAPAVGGWTSITNVHDPYILEIAKFAVSEHNKETGSNLKFVWVQSGQTQVVAGTNYRLRLKTSNASDEYVYEAEVFDQPWTHTRKLTSFNLAGPILGGWNPIKNLSDPYVQDIAKFALEKYNNDSGYSLALVAVLSGDSQIVSGVNYRLLIKASDDHVYDAVVFDQPSTYTRNLTSFTLSQMPAVWQRIPDVSKPEIQEIANFAVTEHNKAAGSSLVLVAVLSGEKQVVAGINHKLLIKTSDGRVYEAVVSRRSRTPTSRKVISFKLKN